MNTNETKIITFYEDGHIYNVKGMTNFNLCYDVGKKKNLEKFNANKIIDTMMNSPKWEQNKYFGMTKHEIKQLWNKNGATAASQGTHMHKNV